MMDACSIRDVVEQFVDLGVKRSGVLLVHTAFSKVKPVEDGPRGLIAALQAAIGPDGTLVMPSMSDDDDTPFDPKLTSCVGMGVVADMFWRMPGVLRSDSPHAFAASGPHAAQITSPHPVDVPHGLDSPVGRVYDLDGQVLLLGIDHTANTTIHLAESMAKVRYGIEKYAMIRNEGMPTRVYYRETDHCCQNFALVGDWLKTRGLQITGRVGHGEARLARSRDILTVALEQLKANETVFLHPYGVDEECDAARDSIPAN